jgi:hypothetical protein
MFEYWCSLSRVLRGYYANMQLVHKAQLSCATTAQQRLVSRTHHQYTAVRYFAVASLLTSGERHSIHRQ